MKGRRITRTNAHIQLRDLKKRLSATNMPADQVDQALAALGISGKSGQSINVQQLQKTAKSKVQQYGRSLDLSQTIEQTLTRLDPVQSGSSRSDLSRLVHQQLGVPLPSRQTARDSSTKEPGSRLHLKPVTEARLQELQQLVPKTSNRSIRRAEYRKRLKERKRTAALEKKNSQQQQPDQGENKNPENPSV